MQASNEETEGSLSASVELDEKIFRKLQEAIVELLFRSEGSQKISTVQMPRVRLEPCPHSGGLIEALFLMSFDWFTARYRGGSFAFPLDKMLLQAKINGNLNYLGSIRMPRVHKLSLS